MEIYIIGVSKIYVLEKQQTEEFTGQQNFVS